MTFLTKPERTNWCEPRGREVSVDRCHECYTPDCYLSAWEEGRCCVCGKEVDYGTDLAIARDGYLFCDEGCAHKAGYIPCSHCGEWTPWYLLKSDDNDGNICNDCIIEEDYIFCDMSFVYAPSSYCMTCEDRHVCKDEERED